SLPLIPPLPLGEGRGEGRVCKHFPSRIPKAFRLAFRCPGCFPNLVYRSAYRFFFTLTFACSIALPARGADFQPLESLDNSRPSNGSSGVSARTIVTTSSATSYQVNVNSAGQNIVGDAANEPSLCIDPTHPNRIAIGWRQFNNVTNNFRQAGYSFS